MGVKKGLLLWGSAILLCLSGCSVGRTEIEGPKTNEDTFGCVASASFERTMGGRSISGLGADYAAKYAYEYLEDLQKDELRIYTLLNDEKEASFAVEEKEGTHTIFVGSAYEKAQSVVIVRNETESPGEITAEFRNSDGSVYKTVPLNGIEEYRFGSHNIEVMADASEYIYISNVEKSGEGCCIVFSPDGSLYKAVPLGTYYCRSLCAMPNGVVGFEKESLVSRDGERCFDCLDTESGEIKTVFSYKDSRSFDEGGIICANVYDDERVVYADKDGVYLADYSMENPIRIFTWKQNGIAIQDSSFFKARICASDKREINIFVQSNGKETFFVLKEMPENVVKIELASQKISLDYELAVNEFNKKNPDCRIVINNEYDKNILYAKIVSGDGPVLLDSNMIPFKEQEKAWEPLDNLVDRSILEALNEVSVKIGTVNGTLYGAAEGFQIGSLVSCMDIKNWTYETFLDTVEGSDAGVSMICPFINESKVAIVYKLFCYDLYDSYFVNPDNPDRPIDRQKLERVLNDIEKYYDENYDYMKWQEDLFSKRGVAVPASFASPAEIKEVLLFIDKGAEAVGYPGKNGSKSYAYSGSMLVVRANASEKEKEVASRFLSFLLSYEWQHKAVEKGIMASFASREDVVSEQIEAAKKYYDFAIEYGSAAYSIETVDAKKVEEYLKNLFDTVSFETDINEDYGNIVCEELDSYYNEGIGIEALEDRLNKRIGLLLKEKR